MSKRWSKHLPPIPKFFILILLLHRFCNYGECYNTLPLKHTIVKGVISLTDNMTRTKNIKTIFNDMSFEVSVNLIWDEVNKTMNSSELYYTMSVDGTEKTTGTYMLNSSRMLPSKISPGFAKVMSSGAHDIAVTLYLNEDRLELTRKYQSYPAAVSIIPVTLVFLIIAVFKSRSTTVALGIGVFVGGCIKTGSITEGYTQTTATYIVGSVSEKSHIYTFLLISFFSGAVALFQKSGGFDAFVSIILRHAKTRIIAQLITFISGIFCVFDDFLSILLVGNVCRPITNELCISCEKLAFLIDVTAGPVSFLIPFSSWVGIVSGLMQVQLNAIVSMNNGIRPVGLPKNGLDLYLGTIPYLYYNIYILYLVLILILQGKDYSSMLIAERKAYVYGHTNGGPGSVAHATRPESSKPNTKSPLLWWNFVIPVFSILGLICLNFIITGDDGSGNQNIYQKFTNSTALESIVVVISVLLFLMYPFYTLQVYQNGKMRRPTPTYCKKFLQGKRLRASADDEDIDFPRQLITSSEFFDSFSNGMRGIISTFLIFAFAWSLAEVTVDVGTPRLFATWGSGWRLSNLPTASYFISTLIALTSGSAVLTITIAMQIITTSAWSACQDGNVHIFYATIAGIIAGAVTGTHVSPISDTSVLSSYASRCQHQAHVGTQIPYASTAFLFAVLCGTLPIVSGLENYVVLLIGLVSITIFSFVFGMKVDDKSGKYDLFTEMNLMCLDSTSLHQLKYDAAALENR